MDMELGTLMAINEAITKDKGFDTKQHTLQLLLIVDEVFEALEHVLSDVDSEVCNDILNNIKRSTEALRHLRKHSSIKDESVVTNEGEFIEELADIFIRWASYSSQFGISNMTNVIAMKMDKNKKRPHKHGRKF